MENEKNEPLNAQATPGGSPAGALWDCLLSEAPEISRHDVQNPKWAVLPKWSWAGLIDRELREMWAILPIEAKLVAVIIAHRISELNRD